jgi:anti-sigma factor RsiW
MSDMAEHTSPEEMAELAALADGTLPAQRRAEVEARVAASPELQGLLERQRQAVVAAQALATEEVPQSLRAAVEARRRALGAKRRRSRPLVPRLALALAAVVAAAVVAAAVLSGGPGAPSVADAARLATQTANGPAPRAAGRTGTKLAIAVEGLPFPDLARFAGWRAVGVRRARIDGRDVTAVFYRKDRRRIGYVIVGGAGLSRPAGGRATTIRRVEYRTLQLKGRLGVTWRRGGHTCVLLGQASRPELLRLASWPLTPPRR